MLTISYFDLYLIMSFSAVIGAIVGYFLFALMGGVK
jgi:hypothetical protein